MIHIHTSKQDVGFDKMTFVGLGPCIKYPEHKTHWTKQHAIAPQILELHESGKDVHVITLSGYVFWSILEQGLVRGTLKRNDFKIHYYRSEEVVNVSGIGPNLELSAELSSHWDGGGQHIANVRSMLGFYKGDQVNKYTFDDFLQLQNRNLTNNTVD
jgi:hypothetical protein